MSLTELPSLLRDEPGLTRALGDPSARIAVVEVARPMAIAALAQLSGRRPLVVACPTGASAGQLFDDLTQFMPEGDVVHFPAWETLPFERVSPSVETMGQRLEVLWRLRNPDHTPAIVVAGVRALLQKLGPGATTTEPIVVRPNAIVDPDELTETLVEFGYRREELVEHRGEFARRGAIVDVYPSTANAPIRIDLWGDEVDRLTRFGVNDQRSTVDLDEVMIFPARELTPTDDVSRRADELIATEPWGREQWERLAEGLHFDGMESWLPWLVDEDRLLTDVLPPHAKVVLVEPRRMRDRATELLAEEDDLAKALASTWARDPDKAFPRLHASPDALLASSGSFWTIDSTPDSPEIPVVEASGWGPVGGDATGLATRLGELLAQGYRVIVAADGEGSAQRLHELLLEHGLDLPVATDNVGDAPGPVATSSSRRSIAAARCRTPRWRSSPSPTSPAGDVRTAPPARRGARARASSRTSRPATTSCTTSTASGSTRAWSSARSAASSATTCSSPTRAATSCTCRPTRSTRCASTSAARRRRCTASAAATSPRRRAGSGQRFARSPKSSSCSTRSGSTASATRSGPTRHGSTRWRRRSRTSRRPTSGWRSTT